MASLNCFIGIFPNFLKSAKNHEQNLVSHGQTPLTYTMVNKIMRKAKQVHDDKIIM
jgi:hypothetical protein